MDLFDSNITVMIRWTNNKVNLIQMKGTLFQRYSINKIKELSTLKLYKTYKFAFIWTFREK